MEEKDSRSVFTNTSRQRRITAAGEALRIWSQGSLPGVLLELNKLATFARVDSENHALLAMASLTAVEPNRVRVFHSELRPREGLLVFCDWHTERANQNLGLDATTNERLTSQCRIHQQGESKGCRAWTVSLCGSSA